MTDEFRLRFLNFSAHEDKDSPEIGGSGEGSSLKHDTSKEFPGPGLDKLPHPVGEGALPEEDRSGGPTNDQGRSIGGVDDMDRLSGDLSSGRFIQINTIPERGVPR